jgi:hypothetical protein
MPTLKMLTSGKEKKPRSTMRPRGADTGHVPDSAPPAKISTVPLGDLKADPGNVRKHDDRNRDAIRASLRRFGAGRSLVIDGANVVRAGNGTLAEAAAEGFDEVLVVEPGPKQVVAVRRPDWTTSEAKAYGVADNRATDLGEFDDGGLAELLQSLQAEGFDPAAMGYSDGEITQLIRDLETADVEIEPASGPSSSVFNAGLDVVGTWRSPYPYFGGKSRVAPEIWKRFGAVGNFVDPFLGSAAMLFARPEPFGGTETINDLDGFVANFWRAVQADPTEVARYADWPVNENDLHARHIWLVERKQSMQATLEGDPDYFDAKIAGWWCWGICCWIGSGFCSGAGPWQAVADEEGNRQLVHLGDAGRGVNRQLVHLGDAGRGVNRQRAHLADAGRGVNRKRVHLADAGQGVNRKRVHLGAAGRGVNRPPGDGERGSDGGTTAGAAASATRELTAYISTLSDRLRRVRVCCGDWHRVCGPVPTVKQGLTAVFLDPPYGGDVGRDNDLYRIESGTVAAAAAQWAAEWGDDPLMRIALCCYDTEHQMPKGWKSIRWKTAGGYAVQADGQSRGKENVYRERIWFSPHCLPGHAD